VTAGLLILAAYLIGAIPFGLLIGRLRGVDIREHGSRNIGATNVGRVVGRPWGLLCLALDILKGFGPTLTAALLLREQAASVGGQLSVVAVAAAAVLGHVFPVYLGFKGGKGVATTIGVALGVWPHFTIAMGIALVAYAVVRHATGMVSLGSLTLAVAFPAALMVRLRVSGQTLADHWPLVAVAVLLGVMIMVRHRENVRRLLRGEELGTRDRETESPGAHGRNEDRGSRIEDRGSRIEMAGGSRPSPTGRRKKARK
jgi:glycerol-3-phosphate acyltransferase PlsY